MKQESNYNQKQRINAEEKTIKDIKKELETQILTKIPPSPDEINYDFLKEKYKELDKRVEHLESIKEKYAEFIFETIAVIMTILSLIIAIILGLSANWEFTDLDMKNKVIALLASIFVILFIWLIFWTIQRFVRNK